MLPTLRFDRQNLAHRAGRGGLNVYTRIACDVCSDTRRDCPDDMPSLMPRDYWDLPAGYDEDDLAEDP
jgi:hypothetical protein